MKNKHLIALLGLGLLGSAALAEPLGTAFTYQGRLEAAGSPANGLYDFHCALYDAPSGPAQVAGAVTNLAAAVTNGSFTIKLDFGAVAFNGNARWLEISVRSNGEAGFVALAPRQALTPVPHAIFASTASNLNGTLADARLSSNVALLNANQTFTGQSSFSQNVGIGTSSPGKMLTVAGDMEVGASSGDYHHLRLGGGNSSGYLYGSFAGLGDGLSLGYNYYYDGAGVGHCDNSNGPTSRLTMGYGSVTLATGAANTPPSPRMIVNYAGNVGIGTLYPRTALEVNGTVLATGFSGSFAGDGTALTNVLAANPWQVVTTTNQQAQPNTGYMISNDGQVTITLPASPSPGDVVRVSAAGNGAWRVAQNAGQSIRLGSAAAADIGETWTSRAASQTWHGVASSADGTRLVAAVYGGSLWNSADGGLTWSSWGSGEYWQSVASSSDGLRLVAGIYPGFLWTSTNAGATWTSGTNSQWWQAVASSADGTKLVAAAYGGTLWTSGDAGVTWTNRASSRNWYSVASSADGTKLVAAAYGGTLWTSADAGVTWTDRASSRNWYSVASSADGTRLAAAVRGGNLWTSTDAGATWISRASSQNWSSVASSADGTKLVAAVSGGNLWTSTDGGVTWTSRASSRGWSAVAASADGTRLVAAGGFLWTSSPPLAPTLSTTIGPAGYLTGSPDAAIELQYAGNGLWKPLSHEGSIYAY